MSLITILVEDSQTIRNNLIPALSELAQAHVVAVAGSPLEAATVLNAHRDVWQLAVVDLFLSNGSGLAVLDQCKLRHARQHVLVLTNYATPDIRMRCLELGADGVFDKSTELDEFFEVCLRYAQS